MLRIIALIAAISLALALAVAGALYRAGADADMPFGPLVALWFLITFVSALVFAVPLLLHALRRHIADRDSYIGGGALLGALAGLLFPVAMTFLTGAPVTPGFVAMLLGMAVAGALCGCLCGWTFWAFVIGRAAGPRLFLGLVWLLMDLPALVILMEML